MTIGSWGVRTEESLLNWVAKNKIGDDCWNKILLVVRCFGDMGFWNDGIVEVGPVVRVVLDANGSGWDINFFLIIDVDKSITASKKICVGRDKIFGEKG